MTKTLQKYSNNGCLNHKNLKYDGVFKTILLTLHFMEKGQKVEANIKLLKQNRTVDRFKLIT